MQQSLYSACCRPQEQYQSFSLSVTFRTDTKKSMHSVLIKEDRAEVTLGILIKIPPNLLLDLSPITLGRIKMFLKFIFLCLQNMVSGQQEKYIIIPHPSQPLPS